MGGGLQELSIALSLKEAVCKLEVLLWLQVLFRCTAEVWEC